MIGNAHKMLNGMTARQIDTLCDMLRAKLAGDFERFFEITKKTSDEDCKSICIFLEAENDGKKS